MSVFTTVDQDELTEFLSHYCVGELVDYEGISEGIENTNYFVNTTTGDGTNCFVLTLFEHHSMDEMQYFLNLMHHLADHNVPSADPVADNDGHYLRMFKNKPAALVERLKGKSIIETTIDHCAQMGDALGRLHVAGLEFDGHHNNPRGFQWFIDTAEKLQNVISDEDRAMLNNEIDFHKHNTRIDLPKGVIHADLFRDNTLWDGDTLGGIIDFYYACNDALLYDVAVTANDWCCNEDHTLNKDKVLALLSNYVAQRQLTEAEKNKWPVMLRAGAMRFWLSRMFDKHFPREGEMVHVKDPDVFKAIVADRINNHELYASHLP